MAESHDGQGEAHQAPRDSRYGMLEARRRPRENRPIRGRLAGVAIRSSVAIAHVRLILDEYFKDEPMTRLDEGLFAFASYNAGHGRIRQLRREAEKRGLDPNVWFGNVEQIASERIGRETVTYVSSIYEYYVAYRLAVQQQERRVASKEALGSTTGNRAE